MKIDRLIGIITILLQRDQVTAPELAERFEVSRRTINRDIEDICRAGIPLVTTQGYGGGISIAAGYKLDHSLLTEEELQLLFSGMKGMDSISEKAHSPLLAEKLSAGAADLTDSFNIDLASHYKDTLSPKITNNTAVDALTHLIESYLSGSANFISEKIVEMGLSIFRECIPALKAQQYPAEIRDKLMLASAIGGVAIAQTGTSLPHGMGYFLTYEKHLAHGMANGVLTRAYLEQFPEGDEKVAKLLACLGMKDTAEMGAFMDAVLEHTETYTEKDIAYYTERFLETLQKMATFPYPLTKEDVYKMYEKSLLK